MNKLKGALKSKTMWFSAAVMAAGIAQDNLQYLNGIISPQHYGIAVAAIGGVTAVLRAMTNTDLADK